ncbi:hypothetical protein ACLOJK_007621 [Asimina triloba]
MQGRVAKRGQRCQEKPKPNQLFQCREGATVTEAITDRLSGFSLSEGAIQSSAPVSPMQFGTIPLENHTSSNKDQKTIWKPKSYSTIRGAATSDVASADSDASLTVSEGQTHLSESREDAATDKNIAALSKLFRGPMGADFIVDNLTYCQAQIRATFYPKFENEKSDQEVSSFILIFIPNDVYGTNINKYLRNFRHNLEKKKIALSFMVVGLRCTGKTISDASTLLPVRTRMIEIVSNGLATLEVSLKHSGSLFMYAGHKGGAYAKNSYGNIYTAVGVFVLGRMFIEAWGTEARRKQAEFNDFLEKNRVCISMELVTAVLGDHGQRPLEDYGIVWCCFLERASQEALSGKENYKELLSFNGLLDGSFRKSVAKEEEQVVLLQLPRKLEKKLPEKQKPHQKLPKYFMTTLGSDSEIDALVFSKVETILLWFYFT